MEDYKLEIGKVYRSENIVLVSRNFLEKTVTEKTLMVRDINYLLMNKANSLSHTKWMCKYHIVFTPKYRRKIIYNQYKQSIGQILRKLSSHKGVEILKDHLMPYHVHMLVSIPP